MCSYAIKKAKQFHNYWKVKKSITHKVTLFSHKMFIKGEAYEPVEI